MSVQMQHLASKHMLYVICLRDGYHAVFAPKCAASPDSLCLAIQSPAGQQRMKPAVGKVVNTLRSALEKPLADMTVARRAQGVAARGHCVPILVLVRGCVRDFWLRGVASRPASRVVGVSGFTGP
eukprot:scaffold287643_cov49-Prasinocladus_malaysianus.AAC.1